MPYLTPDTIPSEVVTRRFQIPDDINILGAITGAFNELCQAHNWEQFGAVTPTQMSELMAEVLESLVTDNLSMIGMILPCIQLSPPTNTLRCDGQTLLRVDYPKLYALLHTEYIVDADHFKLPDLRNRTIVGTGTTWLMGDEFGTVDEALLEGHIAEHTHDYQATTASVNMRSAATGTIVAVARAYVNPPVPTAANATPFLNVSHLQPSLALRYVCVMK